MRKITFLTLLLLSVFSSVFSDIVVERAVSDALDLRIDFKGKYEEKPAIVQSKQYSKLVIQESDFTPQGQFPEKEYFRKVYLIAVPENSKPDFEILGISSQSVDGDNLIPAQKLISNKEGLSYYDYQRAETNIFPRVNPVELADHGRFDGNRIYAIYFHPLYFINNQAKIIDNIKIRIKYGSSFNKNPVSKSTTSAMNLLNAQYASSNKSRLDFAPSSTFLDLKTSWLKIGIKDVIGGTDPNGTTGEGIYKVSGQQMTNLGIDISRIATDKLAVYSSAGEPLSDNPNNPLFHGAVPITRRIVDVDTNGRFDAEDYVLFYGQPPVSWKRGTNQAHYYTDYSSISYFWINPGIGAEGVNFISQDAKDMISLHTDNLPNLNQVDYFKRYFVKDFRNDFHSEDYKSVWFGKKIGANEIYNLDFPVENLQGNVLCKINFDSNYGYGSTISSSCEIGYFINSNFIRNSTDTNVSLEFPLVNINQNSINTLKMKNNSVNKIKPFLSFELSYQGKIVASPDRNRLFSAQLSLNNNYRLNLEQASNKEIFDVTDPLNVKYSKLENGYCDVNIDKTDNYFYYLTSGNYLAASELSVYDNSGNNSLHKFVNGYTNALDLLIISPDEFYDYLKNDEGDFIKTHKAVDAAFKYAEVVRLSDVINEFGRGYQEPNAIRNFIRYFSDKIESNPINGKLKNVLLVGDGNCDYQNFLGYKKVNHIYPSDPKNGSHQGSDDYYAAIHSPAAAVVHVGIGRFTVMNLNELKTVISKTNEFMLNTTPGIAGQTALFLGDDEVVREGSGTTYTQTEHIIYMEGKLVSRLPKSFIQKKVYLTEYPEITDPVNGTVIKPGAAQALSRYLNQGVRLFTYSGHGKPDQLAHEKAFSPDVWSTVKNKNYYLMMGATCSFGVFDAHDNRGLAEKMLVAPKRGGIGMINSTRSCTAGANTDLFAKIYDNMFNDTTTIGEALMRGKILYGGGSNSAGYMLLGDPGLKIFKAKEIVKDQGQSPLILTTLKPDSIIALIEGENEFQGKLLTAILDAEKSVKYKTSHFNDTLRYKLPGNLILSAASSIKDGSAKVKFILPKDLNYGSNGAKVVFYGFNDQSKQVSGKITGVTIQGGQSGVDNTPPELSVKFNGLDYQAGDPIGADPTIFAVIQDENGINVSGGIGHKMFLEMDGGEKIECGDYFNYFDDSYQKGFLEYQFFGLKPGNHTIKLEAWDTYNNFNTKTQEFKVVSADKPTADWLGNLLNYPNPIRNSGTTFTFNLVSPSIVESIDNYKITVYTISGRKVKVIEIDNPVITSQNQECKWDGKDADGDYPANGVYFYKIEVKFSYQDENYRTATKTVSKIGKLLFAR